MFATVFDCHAIDWIVWRRIERLVLGTETLQVCSAGAHVSGFSEPSLFHFQRCV